MNFFPRLLIGFAAVLLGTSNVIAQTAPATPDGPYLRLEGGWSRLNPADPNGGGVSSNLRTDDGFIAGGATGYKTGPYRLELNLDYSQQSVKDIHFNTDGGLGSALGTGSLNATNSTTSGDASNLALLVNGLYDFKTGTPLTPYLGLGIGGTQFDLDHIRTTNRATNVTLINGSDIEFAYQPIVGLDYAITPQISVGAQYRYFASLDAHVKTTTGQSVTVGNSSHNILVGLTWHFGAPPAPMPAPTPAAAPVPAAPPPPPAPAAQQPHQLFLVFFDFDKATLTPDGRKVVAAAAAAYKRDGGAKVAITGYTDLAGTQQYNMGLSHRRADTVRAALIADGVPADQIAEAWHGKENPRVPTPDGVREPQNRRVEIVLP